MWPHRQRQGILSGYRPQYSETCGGEPRISWNRYSDGHTVHWIWSGSSVAEERLTLRGGKGSIVSQLIVQRAIVFRMVMSFRVELKILQKTTKAGHLHSVSRFSAIVLKKLANEWHTNCLVCCTVCCVPLCRFRIAFGLS